MLKERFVSILVRSELQPGKLPRIRSKRLAGVAGVLPTKGEKAEAVSDYRMSIREHITVRQNTRAAAYPCRDEHGRDQHVRQLGHEILKVEVRRKQG